MRRILILLTTVGLLVTGLLGVATATDSEPLDTRAVDSFVADYLDRHGLPGASVAVVQDAQVVHTAGYGDDSGEESVTPRTPMDLGSISKSITAVAVLQLVDSGDVALDDPVVEHLPAFEVDDPRASEITVRHLLSHTSGLPNPMIVPPADDLTDAAQRLHDWQLDADPGERYAYGNANYWTAARLVEVVSGTDFAEYLDRNVFTPLGMEDTRALHHTSVPDPGLQHGHVMAYGLALPLPEVKQFVAGAGGVISTAEDMARWLTMLTGGGTTPGGETLLPPDLLEEAQSPQPGSDGYGLGWTISGSDVEPARVGHSGTSASASAQLDVVPSSGYGVVVMLNSRTPTFEHNYEISAGIIEVTEGGSPAAGTPVAMLVDAVLGLLTLVAVARTFLGVRRAGRWAMRRAGWPGWRYALRLLPQLVFPALAMGALLVVPSLQGNSSTPLDVFGRWPAAIVLLLVLGVSGVVLIVARLLSRYRRGAGESRGNPRPNEQLSPTADSSTPG
ncbi:MAG TPA: serine hydrolase domain-containing protein [Jiangellaceae bacterium]|nr:serine hydrolase domain-containing protein [Jiangellaceae bacterium]